MKIRFATTKRNPRSKRVWLTAAAILPLLTACSTDDLSGLWFGNSSGAQEPASVAKTAQSAADKANFDKAACGLFFGQHSQYSEANKQSDDTPVDAISLEGTPQENLLQAITYDMNGDYAHARKLYVWLTATPPDFKINLDCGQGVKLSGSINSLAQRRLVALDTASPEFARSAEIDSVVASATVAPGPELPDPPQVERDRRFYQSGGVVEADPEDSTSPIVRMEMEVSENTATLTSVDRRTVATGTAATAAASQPSARQKDNALLPNTASVPDEAPAPVPVPHAEPTRPALTAEVATISGDSASSEHSGTIVDANSRPIEQGNLDIKDPAPTQPMIELPIASTSGASNPTTPKPANSMPAPPVAETSPSAQTGAPYYAVQLAAYRSRGRAEGAWGKFQSASGGILDSASHEVVSIAIEGKGLFFRLLTGNYGSSAEATRACNTLKAAGTDCLVRRVTP